MKTLPTLLLPALFLVSACGGGGGGAAPDAGPGSGGGGGTGSAGTSTLALYATDAPFDHALVKSASIQIEEIRTHRQAGADGGEGDWLSLYAGAPFWVNLYELQAGLTRELVSADVPSGSYDELRLILSAAELELTNGNVYHSDDGSLQLTSQDTSGLKLKLEPAIVAEAGFATSLLLDFDLSKTFKPVPGNDAANASKYHLHPVVHVSNLSTAGQIGGFVLESDGQGGATGVQAATVYLLAPGEQDLSQALTTTGSAASGAYALLGVDAGVYDLLAAKGAASQRVDGIVVQAGSAQELDFLIAP